jgi:hypothetical protein
MPLTVCTEQWHATHWLHYPVDYHSLIALYGGIPLTNCALQWHATHWLHYAVARHPSVALNRDSPFNFPWFNNLSHLIFSSRAQVNCFRVSFSRFKILLILIFSSTSLQWNFIWHLPLTIFKLFHWTPQLTKQRNHQVHYSLHLQSYY